MSIDKQIVCTVIPFLKNYNVFNIAQTNLEELHPDKMNALKSKYEIMKTDDAEGMYDNIAINNLLKTQDWVCPIEYTRPANGAYYNTIEDNIVVPMKSQFKVSSDKDGIFSDGQRFYSTLLHEMIHSTGSKGRLNRTKGKRFGDTSYAIEELVAELGAARVGQVLGFDKRILDNNAMYLNSWIKCLREKPQYILTLMRDVEKASKMILEKIAA